MLSSRLLVLNTDASIFLMPKPEHSILFHCSMNSHSVPETRWQQMFCTVT
uniref:Uncharacterized protein n=1 Tax=Anguilla anguilla TaxID=7936 RepID=A0A0E9W3I6_ANGAN